MKRLLFLIPLLFSTMAIGPCGSVNIGALDAGTDAPGDSSPDRDASDGGSGGGGSRLSCTPTTWQSQVVLTLPSVNDATFASDAAGGLHLAVGLTTAGGLGVASSYAPQGAAWTPTALVAEAAVANATVFSDATFRTHIVHTPSGTWDRLRRLRSAWGGPWVFSEPNDVLVNVGVLAAVADLNGDPQAFATDLSGGTFLRSPGGVWTKAAIPAANRFSGATSMVMDSAGRTMLLYENGTMMRLESILVATDGTLGTAEPIAPIGSGASARVLAPDSNTFSVVFSDAAGGLRLATKAGTAAWTVTPLGPNPLACRTCSGIDGLGQVHALTRASGVLTYVRADANNQVRSEVAEFGAAGGGPVYGLEIDPTGTVNVLAARTDATTTPLLTTFHHVYRCPEANAGRALLEAANAGHWLGLSSATLPHPRYLGQGMAFDGSQHEMVLFGGHHELATGSGALPDTWTYPTNGAGWVKKALASGTHPGFTRLGHGMAFDPLRARVVLMGGGSAPDVWEWNGATATWSERTGLAVPAGLIAGPQRQTRLAYDSRRAKFVVLQTGNPWALWDWDSATGVFTSRASTGTQPATLTSISYDAASGVIIGFGGGATWEWAPETGVWTNRTGQGAAPASGEIVASGGGRYAVHDGQTTWEWSRSATNWAERKHGRTPPAVRAEPFVAYHPERGAAWMFGGSANGGGPYVVNVPLLNVRAEFAYRDTFEWHGAVSPP